jgi:hypothetical protein
METEDNHEIWCHCQDHLPKICLYRSSNVFELVSECAADPYLAADRQITASQMSQAHTGAHHCRQKERSASNPIYKFHRRGKI